MAHKAKPAANNKKAHSWKHCPIGYHYVREHIMHISPSKKHPKGSVVIRHAHCRKNVHGSKEAQMPEKFIKVTAENMVLASTAPGDPGDGDDQDDTFKMPDADGIKKLIQRVNPKGSPKLIALVDSAMLEKYGINTPNRLAAFIAQISSESDFHFYKENPSKEDAARYDKKSSIGSKYRGRGLIQLTSKGNYIAIGKAIGIDLANNPELAVDDQYNFLIALEFWKMQKGNKIADTGDIDEVTRKINGKNAAQERLDKSRFRYEILKKYLDEGAK